MPPKKKMTAGIDEGLVRTSSVVK
jgi:TolA-binding protein